jgi:uncharacterized protein YbjT (DUF2867 family)
MSKQTLVVFGATGNQGTSIINYVLADAGLSSKYAIRGLTRNPSSHAAQALKEKGVEVVKCDISKDEDVRTGLKGAQDVFLMTVSSTCSRGSSVPLTDDAAQYIRPPEDRKKKFWANILQT